MIDFIRMYWRDKTLIEDFVSDQNNFNELRQVLEVHSGEIEYPYTTKLETMDISITEKSAFIKNSLHKLYNFIKFKENKNYSDYTYSQLNETINYVTNNLHDMNNSRLTRVEFGLNIELDTPAEYIIINNLMMHRNSTHSQNKGFEGRGRLKVFEHSNYDFKIYDKAKQYELYNNIIRFEIKHKKSKSFQPMGIFNIQDLKDKSYLKLLFDDLMKRFEELTIVDDYRSNTKLSKKDRIALDDYTNYNYWNNLSIERKLRNRKSAEKKKFEALLLKNELLKTKDELRNKLNSKFQFLINN